ncbi:eCIS core domain-containing protein [Chitinophaga alhagiae]|uniref:eCIS core domain-containing protein n=1 Tax=Chitinophaga alhagiae TaxID=2203219 RepID=UPI000E5B5CAB|nr:DUF4157 domain-containing protein [Chitinophaga alhagiae]
MKASADAVKQPPKKNASSQKKEAKPFFAPSAKGIQPKLKIGSPNDTAEKEADHMADKVMRQPDLAVPAAKKEQEKKAVMNRPAPKIVKSDAPVQMKGVVPGKEEPKVQKKDAAAQGKEEPKVQMKEDAKPAAPAKEEPKIQKKDAAAQGKEEPKVQMKEDAKPAAPAKEEPKIQKKDAGAQDKEEPKVQMKEDAKPAAPAKEEPKIQKKEGTAQGKEEPKVQKKEDAKPAAPAKEDPKVQMKGEGTPSSAINDIGEGIRQQGNGGHTLSDDTKNFMEHRFNADFSNVRIHTGPEATQMNNQVGARAFTYQNHIFFNNDQYQPGSSGGRHLLAHELTHVMQQGQSVQRSEAPAATAVVPPQVQRFIDIDIDIDISLPSWQDALDWLAEKADNIPGFRMFCIVLGSNPISGAAADRSAANILRAAVEFLPGGHQITQALEKYNVFEKAGTWIESKLKKFSNLLGDITAAVNTFLNRLDFIDIITSPFQTWENAKSIFSTPVEDMLAFIQGLFEEVMQFIRDAVLKPLAALAANSRGFDLLCAVIGFNPITNESVPRNADTLIGGFMKFIGREDIWDNIKKGNAVQKAFDWFQKAMKGLMDMVKQFPQDFIAMLKSLEVTDFLNLPSLFEKVFGVFSGFAAQFSSWAMNTIFDLLEIVFSVVAPGAMPYLQRVRGAFKSILEKPMVFVGHLINAAKQGFNQFKNRIGTWLKKALVNWLLGSLAGANIYIPQSFSLKEILKLGLSVFGLTWQNIRGKLVKAVGETAVAAMETGFDIIKTLITEGPAAAWDKIQDKINELKDQFISEVTNFVTVTVVQTAVVKLLSSLNPAGAFIQAIIAIYNTIMFLVQKIQQIAAVGRAVIDSIVQIASGAIGAAANKVENVLGGMLSLAISFLANFLGLGKISDKIVAIIKKLRAPVDKAIDKVVEWIVKAGKSFLAKAKSKILGWLKIRKTFTGGDNKSHSVYFSGKDENAQVYIASTPTLADQYLDRLAKLDPGNPAKIGQAKTVLSEIGAVKRSDKKDEDKQKELEKLFGKLAGILSGIKGTDGLKDKMDVVALTFQRNPKHPEKEFNDQLHMQEVALNKMKISNWLANRYNFEQRGRDEAGLDRGKRKERQVLFSQFLKVAYEEIKKKNPGIKPDALDTQARADAEQMVNDHLAGKALLHRVDQVAGGEGDDFGGHGASNVNSALGSLWKAQVPLVVKGVEQVKPEKHNSESIKVKLN